MPGAHDPLAAVHARGKTGRNQRRQTLAHPSMRNPVAALLRIAQTTTQLRSAALDRGESVRTRRHRWQERSNGGGGRTFSQP